MDGGELDVGRQARAEPVDVDAADVRLFRFQEQLVSVAVAKAVDLVLDARAVARTLAVDAPAEHGAVLESAAQDVVGLDVRARNPADAVVTDKLVCRIAPEVVRVAAGDGFRQVAVAHRPRHVVATLYVAFIKVDCIGIQPAGGARLETAQRNPLAGDAFRKLVRTRLPHAPTDARLEPGEHLGGQECSARYHERARDIAFAVQQSQFQAPVGHARKRGEFALDDRQAGKRGNHLADHLAVILHVALGARAPHGGPLAHVQHAELDSRLVGQEPHQPAESVDVADNLALGHAAHGRVARHSTDGIDIHREHGGLYAQFPCGMRRLDTGMTAADDDNVKFRLNHNPLNSPNAVYKKGAQEVHPSKKLISR